MAIVVLQLRPRALYPVSGYAVREPGSVPIQLIQGESCIGLQPTSG